VRENVNILGNLVSDFDFNQNPRAPVILRVQPLTTLMRSQAVARSGRATVTGGDADG
jgi:hypothetical protein